MDKVKDFIQEIEKELIEIRRDFHKYAESGWQEIRTSSIIAEKLENIGYKVLVGDDVCDLDSRMGVPSDEVLENAYDRAISQGAVKKYADKMKYGKTGVIGILENGEGPVVGMRFDIDALDLYEDTSQDHFPSKNGFASVNEKTMHACGHDGHGTIGLGVAKTLMEFKDSFSGTVKLIFQPAEEGVRGAKSIVEKGHLDDVDYLLAPHITSNKAEPEADFFPGSGGALATSKLDVTFKGASTHAAGSPELGRNAALGMATAILNLYSIPRHSEGVTRINVGVAQAGTGRNVIPDVATLQIETRGETTKINDFVRDYAENIIKGAAEMHGLTYRIEKKGEANSLESDQELMERAREVGRRAGLKPAKESRMVLTGSEDVSYMVERVQDHGGQATFMRLLTDVEASGHNRSYDFDEGVLTKGTLMFSSLALDILKK